MGRERTSDADWHGEKNKDVAECRGYEWEVDSV